MIADSGAGSERPTVDSGANVGARSLWRSLGTSLWRSRATGTSVGTSVGESFGPLLKREPRPSPAEPSPLAVHRCWAGDANVGVSPRMTTRFTPRRTSRGTGYSSGESSGGFFGELAHRRPTAKTPHPPTIEKTGVGTSDPTPSTTEKLKGSGVGYSNLRMMVGGWAEREIRAEENGGDGDQFERVFEVRVVEQ